MDGTTERGEDIVAIVGSVPEGATIPDPTRCTLCLGPTGDDSNRCELPSGHADPDHLFNGIKHRLAPGVRWTQEQFEALNPRGYQKIQG